MKTSAWRSLAILALIAVTMGVLTSQAQDPQKPKKRADFMRQKLEYSKKIMEGLVTDDFAAVSEAAVKLKELSRAAEWDTPRPRNVDEYMAFTGEFQRDAEQLRKKADAKSLDGATLAFTRLTFDCVDCHRYVRGAAK